MNILENTRKKNLLGIKDLTEEEITLILRNTSEMKSKLRFRSDKAANIMGTRVTYLLSGVDLRSKLYFETAAKSLMGTISTIALPVNECSENMNDIVLQISGTGADILIISHYRSGIAEMIAHKTDISIINAGDGMNENPTQALAGIFTVMENKGYIDGLKIAIVGNVAENATAKSYIYGFTRLGAKIAVGGPSAVALAPFEKLGVCVCGSVQETLFDADVVISAFPENGRGDLCFPNEREYARFFSIDEKRMLFAKAGAIILGSGYMKRGINISSEAVDSQYSLIDAQSENSIALDMALLYLLSSKGGEKYENID